MNLRRKILIAFFCIAVVSGASVLLLVFITHGDHLPVSGRHNLNLLATGSILLSIIFQVALAYAVVQKLILGPLRRLADSALVIASGRPAILDVDRNDELGLVANSVNHMAENVRSTMQYSENLVRRAVTEAESAMSEKIIADQLSATGRVAVHMARNANSPLVAIDGLTDNLEWAKKRGIQQMTARIRHAIGDGIEESRRQTDVRVIGVCESLRQAISLLAEKLGKSKIELFLSTEDKDGKSDPILVMADPDDLCHVFYNLVENAIESMPEGGTLTVKAERVYSWAVVEIIDTGGGMTVEEVASAFDYFHTTKASGRGYGLGLSLSRHIVLGYGGSLTMNSQKGQGTRTAVELPLSHNATTVRRNQRTGMQ